MPYVLVKGSLNSPILRGKYVKVIKERKRIQSIIKEILLLQLKLESIILYEIYSPIMVAI